MNSNEDIIQEAIDTYLQDLSAVGFDKPDILNEVQMRLMDTYSLKDFRSKLIALKSLLKDAETVREVRQRLEIPLNINEDPENNNMELNNNNPKLPNSNQEGGRRKRRKTRKLKKKSKKSRRRRA